MVALNESTIPFICDVVNLHRCVWKDRSLKCSWRNFVPTRPTPSLSSPSVAKSPVTLWLIRGWPVGGARAFLPSAGTFNIAFRFSLFVCLFFVSFVPLPFIVPIPPSGELRITDVTHSTMLLDWDAAPGAVRKYIITYKPAEGESKEVRP